MEDIIHKINYISQDNVKEIKNYYDNVINDTFSNGPRPNPKLKYKMQGCWDRPLRLENTDNPLLPVIDKLHNDFGDFEIHCASVRYMVFPFGPHSDIRNTEWLQQYRQQFNRGYTFLIPLWWQDGYQPGTAFFNSPPKDEEPLYNECIDCLPEHTDEHKIIERDFGVKKILKWQQPGDLVGWMNFQWHCSLSPAGYVYDAKKWVKEFISIETYYPKIKTFFSM